MYMYLSIKSIIILIIGIIKIIFNNDGVTCILYVSCSRQQRKKSRGIHECIKCRARFRHMMKLVEHLKNLHGIERAFNCDECGKAFRSPMNITRHKLIHTGQKKFACDLCDYVSNQKSNLESHLRRHRKDYVYKCEKCQKGFFDRADYEEHFNVHVKDKFYQCEYCKKMYSYKKNLTRHLKTQHTNLSCNTNLQSPATNNKLIDKVNLTDQKLLKDKTSKLITTKYLCDLCGKALSSHKRLVIHRRVHTGEKIATCEICSKRFSSQENFKIHLRIHTGEKPHVCSECGRRFTQRTSLVMHLRYHSGERPFKCPDCDKSFISGTFLKNHRKVHEKISADSKKNLARDNNHLELNSSISKKNISSE